jgi:hypothetical protein
MIEALEGLAQELAENSAAVPRKIWTDEEFMALPDDGNRYEVVNGELVAVGLGRCKAWVLCKFDSHPPGRLCPQPKAWLYL